MKAKALFLLIFLLLSKEAFSYEFMPSEEMQKQISQVFSSVTKSIVVAQYN